MDELNAEQLAAIGSTARTTIVPAGPGSGKSRTLVARVRWHLARGISPLRLVAFTFTNSGANVIANRLAPIKLAWIGTIHGYCFRLIQQHGYLIGYRPGVTIVTEAMKLLLLNQSRVKLGRPISDKEMMARESRDAELIWLDYEHAIKRANMIDYDRILIDAYRILETPVPHMMVLAEVLGDELQDSGPADWDIIWGLPTESRFLVGDVDQSIFAFRKADPLLFMHADRKGRDEFPLELNYRSDTSICDVANRLIEFNSNRIPKQIIPVSKERGIVLVTSYEDDNTEIYGVWGKINELTVASTSHAVRFAKMNEIAVLSRTKAIAKKFRDSLRGLGLPIKSTLVRLPIDWPQVLATLSVIVDPSNPLLIEELLRLRGYPPAYINEQRIRATRHESPMTFLLFPALCHIKTIEEIFPALQVSEESLRIVVDRWKALPADSTVADLLADLSNTDRWNVTDTARDGVTVSTIHAAKGREWDVVFIVAMEEGVMPSKQSLSTGVGDIEEERRLCFVAVTRARHQLYLSHANVRTSFFQANMMTPSRFIEEMSP